jgi:outer membrane receptor protein involved in Fe transport
VPAGPVALPDVNVVAATPLLGSGIDRDQVPAATQVLTGRDIDRTNVPSLTGAILDNIPSATINDTSGSIFQPDILFRGFTASPVAGTAQGLAVYVNGARFNDPFGDTVNWDLIPSIAIDTVNVEASNPVFGLNALGGSINVQMKNGFTFDGADLTAYGGSFDRGSGVLEYGRQFGDFAVYGAGEITHDGGYRQTQSSDIYRLYTDLGWRHDAAEVHLSIDAADNSIGNPGASPVQELYADPSGIFSGPNTVFNKYVSVNLNGSYAVNDTIAIQGLAYYQTLTQRVTNGATGQGGPCDNGTGDLCNDDGTPVTTYGNAIVPDFLHGGTYSNLVLEGLQAHSYGGSVQLTNDATVLGHRNHLALGASFDGSDSVFNAETLIGGFTTDGTQLFVGPPEVTQVQPDEGIQPVKVATVTRYYGLFVADVLTLAPGLDLSLNGRFNNAEIDSHDKLGTVLTGQHTYNRFNPSAGLTYHITPAVEVYGSYAEANRAPTPTELSCSSAANPCSLLNFFIGDPNLKQVVARTFEGGLRGRMPDLAGGRLSWNADYYHTKDHDDLIFQTALDNPNLAFYTNAGSTRRQGAEANLHFDTQKLHAVLGYAYTDATFQSPLLLGSASNPFADANGNEHVRVGDRIPGIPEHRGTAVVEYKITDRWTVGGNAILTSDQIRFGDEANLGKPVGGYVIVDFDTSYRVTDNITVFGLVNNVTDRRYDTYGTYGPIDAVPFPNVPGGVTDPRTASPGAPIAGYGGVRVRF